jgi:hypothetical protein
MCFTAVRDMGYCSSSKMKRLGIKIAMFFYAPRYFGLWRTIFWAWVLAKLISHRAAERKAQALSMDQIRRHYPRAERITSLTD